MLYGKTGRGKGESFYRCLFNTKIYHKSFLFRTFSRIIGDQLVRKDYWKKRNSVCCNDDQCFLWVPLMQCWPSQLVIWPTAIFRSEIKLRVSKYGKRIHCQFIVYNGRSSCSIFVHIWLASKILRKKNWWSLLDSAHVHAAL